ncbi:MAG: TetR family transcriptional regulator [Bacteroidales bacterium]|jgi:AcrR family transcriptional regulator|nr:TetR family transcriptional regulator [Bacteroidales bacterium]
MFNNKNDYTEVQQRIVLSARKLFIQRGLKGTTVRDIANDSNTNIAMVNYYFRSKNNLFETVFGETFNILVKKIFSIKNSNLPFFDLVREWIYSYYDTLIEYPDLPNFVLNELSHNPGMLKDNKQFQQLHQLYYYLVEQLLEEERKGTIRHVPVNDFVINIISLSVFPFAAYPVVSQFLNLSKSQYVKAMKKHREYVADFIIQAIRK